MVGALSGKPSPGFNLIDIPDPEKDKRDGDPDEDPDRGDGSPGRSGKSPWPGISLPPGVIGGGNGHGGGRH